MKHRIAELWQRRGPSVQTARPGLPKGLSPMPAADQRNTFAIVNISHEYEQYEAVPQDGLSTGRRSSDPVLRNEPRGDGSIMRCGIQLAMLNLS